MLNSKHSLSEFDKPPQQGSKEGFLFLLANTPKFGRAPDRNVRFSIQVLSAGLWMPAGSLSGWLQVCGIRRLNWNWLKRLWVKGRYSRCCLPCHSQSQSRNPDHFPHRFSDTSARPISNTRHVRPCREKCVCYLRNCRIIRLRQTNVYRQFEKRYMGHSLIYSS